MSGWLRLTAWAALMAVAAAFIALRGDLRTDLTLFLPPAADPVQHLVLDQLRQGPAARVILAAVDGGDEAASARLNRDLGRALGDDSAFAAVYNGEAGAALTGADTLARYRYLLSPRMDQPSPLGEARLRQAFQAIHEQLTGVVPADLSRLQRDPTGELRHLLSRIGPAGPATRGGVWMTGDGRGLLVARTAAPPLDLDAQAAAVERLRQHFSDLPGAGSAALTLTGPPVIALESRRIIKAEVQRLSILATALALGLLLVVTRSWRFLLLGIMPMAAAVVAGVTAVLALLGSIHGIALAFGATLVGVALDYPIHLFLHRHSDEPAPAAMRRIRSPLWLGALTTALGFGALCLSGVSGLLQLGVFAIAGVLAAALTTHWLLPPLVGRAPPRRVSVPQPAGRWPSVAAVALLAAGAAVVAVRPPAWQTDLERLSPVPSSLKTLDHQLRAAAGLAEPRDMLVVAGLDRQQALRRTEAVVAGLRDQKLATALPLTDWLASAERQTRRQARLPDPGTLTATVRDALQGLPLRPDAFQPFIDAVAASRELPPLRPGQLEGGLAALAGQRLIDAQDRWWSLVPLRDVDDRDALAALASGYDGAHYLDLKAQTNALVTGYRDQALRHFAIGAALIGLCLLVLLGWRRRTLQVGLVAFGGALMAVAVLSLTGAVLSLFSLVSLLLVVGLGLDYGLFTHTGHDARRSLGSATVCAASTVLAFAVLASADVVVLADIGRTVAVGAAAAWLLAWLLAAREAPPTA